MNLFKKIFSSDLKFPRKKVLVLEGGGMRGIFLTGVLQAFTDRNYFPWELIIGSSAGALTGTAYATNQIHLARDAFFTKLLTSDFIHIGNILNAKKHILDLDWMINTILQDKLFDTKTLKKACRVLITATDCSPYNPPRTVYLDSRKDDIKTALKATAAIPYLYRGFVEYGEYKFLDGGLLDPIPFHKALAMGYREEDILVIVTRKKGYRKKEESFWIKMLYESYYKDPKHRLLVQSMENRFKKYNKLLDSFEDRYKKIDVIYPPDYFEVDRLTQEEKKILNGFEMGVDAAKKFLKLDY
jgi:predicted patatin/cPLA2 family phospholipase